MGPSRREFVAACVGAFLTAQLQADEPTPAGDDSVIDAHVHVWDLKRFHLPWLSPDDKVLHRDFLLRDYLQATAGLAVRRAVYVEIGLDGPQQPREIEAAGDLCHDAHSPFAAAIVGGDPAADDFREYVRGLKDRPFVRGIRHGYDRGKVDSPAYARGLRLLGEPRLTFDLLLGPDLLTEAASLAIKAPDTQFILDHCGNIDPLVFSKNADAVSRERRDLWRRGIDRLAMQQNVSCKISGVMEAASAKATEEDAAPVVNHCLDAFGPDRVLFASNWPVCLKGTTLADWLRTVRQIVAHRNQSDHRKLFHDNVAKIYRLPLS